MRAILIIVALIAAWIILTRVIFPKLGIEFKSG